MTIRPCPKPSPDCPYFDRKAPSPLRGKQEHGCFEDKDHIVPQRLGTTALAKAYIDLPENKQQMCRWEHEKKTARGDEPLPSEEYMFNRVADAAMRGAIQLSKTKREKLKLGEI